MLGECYSEFISKSACNVTSEHKTFAFSGKKSLQCTGRHNSASLTSVIQNELDFMAKKDRGRSNFLEENVWQFYLFTY